jgi:hypothetical protein
MTRELVPPLNSKRYPRKLFCLQRLSNPLSSYSLDRLQERFKNDCHQIECDISYKTIEVRSLIDDAVGQSTKVLNLERDPDRPQVIDRYANIVRGDKVGQDKVR